MPRTNANVKSGRLPISSPSNLDALLTVDCTKMSGSIEKEFKVIRPKFFSGNRRYYDNKSIYILKKIKDLLKEDGMTINGAKKYLAKSNSFKLDVSNLNTIKASKNNIKNKVEKISNLIKQIKELG